MADLISGVFNEWLIGIIGTLIGIGIGWGFSLLPPKWQIHKRIYFAKKVEKAVSTIEISIETKKALKTTQIDKEIMSKYFDMFGQMQKEVYPQHMTFLSKITGANYKINPSEKEPEEDDLNRKDFVIINCSEAFKITTFGRISGLNDVIDEIQSILDNFSDVRKGKDNIIVRITIAPKSAFKNDKLSVNYNEKTSTISYTIKEIKIQNKGTSYLKEVIAKVFYEWMTTIL